MIIDKKNGEWESKNTTLLDDYAYQLYLNNKISNCTKQSQAFVIYCYQNENKFKSFYKKAHYMILKDKLNKIENEVNL